MGTQREDLTGKRFGKLQIDGPADDYISPQGCHFPQWICSCDCGKIIIARSDSLKNGHTKSCGCLKNEKTRARAIHGDRRKGKTERLYTIWANMIQRCSNPNNPNYQDYGGRGITVDASWLSYPCFKEWSISNGYEKHLTLDRKDTNSGYGPNNCRWVSWKTQQNNKRSNHLLTYDGRTFDMAEWAVIAQIPYSTLRSRVNKLGWSDEKAITTPVRKLISQDK